MSVPKDPYMLLSFVNTQLRDNYASPAELCAALSLDPEDLTARLAAADFHYIPALNQFK